MHFLVFVCCFLFKHWLFSGGPPNLGIVCTGLELLTDLSASLTTIITALAISIAVYIITCIMFCLATVFHLFFLRLPYVGVPVSLVYCV